MVLTIYRYSGTGIFGYGAFDGNREIFGISGDTSWDPEVSIVCEEGKYQFRSSFDRETTLIPRLTSRSVYNRSGSLAAVLRLEDDRLFSYLCPGRKYLMEDREGTYLAFEENRCVFSMKRANPSERVPGFVQAAYAGFDVEPYFTLTTQADMPLPTVALMAAFPMLRFAR